MALKNSGIPSYTWATKPSVANWPTYRPIIVTDVGVGGSLWHHDGVNWRPVNGSFVLASKQGSLTAPVASLSAAGQFVLPGGNPQIPANLLIPGSSIIRVQHAVHKVGGAAVSLSNMRLGTAGTTADSIISGSYIQAPTLSDLQPQSYVFVDISTRVVQQTVNTIAESINQFVERTTNINTAELMYISLDQTSVTAPDVVQLISYTVTITV